MPVSADEIKNVLGGLFASIDRDEIEQAAAFRESSVVQEALNALREGKPDSYFFSLIYPIEQLLQGVFKAEGFSSELQFYCMRYNAIERHYCRLIDKLEGSQCSADKSRAIMRSLLRFLLTGKEIVWNRDQEYTYHIPDKVFQTHALIYRFFKGLYHFEYGDPTLYASALKDVFEDFGPDFG